MARSAADAHSTVMPSNTQRLRSTRQIPPPREFPRAACFHPPSAGATRAVTREFALCSRPRHPGSAPPCAHPRPLARPRVDSAVPAPQETGQNWGFPASSHYSDQAPDAPGLNQDDSHWGSAAQVVGVLWMRSWDAQTPVSQIALACCWLERFAGSSPSGTSALPRATLRWVRCCFAHIRVQGEKSRRGEFLQIFHLRLAH